MAEFKAGTREQVKNGQAQYVAGDIVSKDAINAVGGGAVRTKAVTQITGRSQSGRITNSQTVLYVEKNGTFQPAAIKKDGKWSYSDSEYPLMAGVADAVLQKDLANSDSVINKTTNNGIKAELGKRMDVLPEDVNTVMGGLQNVASPADEPSGLEGQPNTAETSAENVARSSELEITQNNTGTRKQFDKNLIFPLDLGKSNMDVIRFDMLEFKPRKLTKPENQGALPGLTRRRNFKVEGRNSIGAVTLPIPAGIQDQNRAGWGDGRLNPVQAAGINLAMTAFNEGFGSMFNTAGKTLENISNNTEAFKTSVKNYFAAGAVGKSFNEILARTEGAVINPNLELLFNGPTLRPFNFTFKMSARSRLESEAIVKIIRFFKQGMAPQRTDANLFVKAPHTFQLQYRHRGTTEGHNFLNKFKECALIGLSINYTPENNYATFEDGAMVSYEMQMQFQELDPVYNEDYTDLDQNADTQIGF